MSHDYLSRSICMLLVTLIWACGDKASHNGADTPINSAAAVAPATPTMPTTNDGKNPCPHTGRWELCNVEQRIKQSGFVMKPAAGGQAKRAGFSVTPKAYTIGQSRVEVFVYSDEKLLAADVAKLDTVRVAPIGDTASWNGTPTFIRAGNLIVVYIGNNPRTAERLSLAITAGAPQPGSPR